ncbi:type II secretion system protein [Shewanella sp. GXUN23E]|uniref:type II secretion system protein n=1 Tax=Shewanella sp. GXUN23E TaxID=3422498 RepID=UPI003D7D7683
MKKQNGFTLIELVVVIIILGILAVVAAPKFINLSDDAELSAAQGTAGALKSAVSMVHAKALIAGPSAELTEVVVDAAGNKVAVNATGYPVFKYITGQTGKTTLEYVMDTPEGYTVVTTDDKTTLSKTRGNKKCEVVYTVADASVEATCGPAA